MDTVTAAGSHGYYHHNNFTSATGGVGAGVIADATCVGTNCLTSTHTTAHSNDHVAVAVGVAIARN